MIKKQIVTKNRIKIMQFMVKKFEIVDQSCKERVRAHYFGLSRSLFFLFIFGQQNIQPSEYQIQRAQNVVYIDTLKKA